MSLEEVREFALSLHENVTEQLFAENWISWRIAGKWFLLMQLRSLDDAFVKEQITTSFRTVWEKLPQRSKPGRTTSVAQQKRYSR